MEYVALGRTNALVSRTALAAGSLRLLDAAEQARLIRASYDAGINYFDMRGSGEVFARDALSALAGAFLEIRQNVFLGLCVTTAPPARMKVELEDALTALNTDYIDILEVTGLSFLPESDGVDGIVPLLETLKREGKIRFCGIAHPFSFAASELVPASIFETLQFPFNNVNSESGAETAALCEKREIGCLVCDPLCAPFEELSDAYSFLLQYEHVVPLWEIRNDEQMRALLTLTTK
jgi:aryl-alcohol dehydrogenase-like predicted oxidoreductase